MKNNGRITINDVAREAGVSKSTVSLVLSNHKGISEATKKRVHEIIDKLNYIPNNSARLLATGKSNKIAIICYRLSSPFLQEILRGFEDKFYEREERDYTIDFYSTEGSDSNKIAILKDILYAKKADGIVMVTLGIPIELQEEYKKYKIPIVLIEERSDTCNWIDIDGYRGGELAANHFIQTGRKNVGMVNAGSFGVELGHFATERYNGFVDTLMNNGVKFNTENYWELNYLTKDSGYDITEQIVNSGVDAVFCAAGDYVATGILECCKELRVQVPEQLAILGYDNMFHTSLVEPAMSTIAQPLYEIGKKSFEMVYEQIKEKKYLSKKVLLKPKLIKRKST